MIPEDEMMCRRNARALWVPFVAFASLAVFCGVMMVVRADFGWRAWAGTATMFAAAAFGLGKILYWRRWARALKLDSQKRPEDL